MSFAIISDSTADLRQQTLSQHNIMRVPLYVTFQDSVYKDWLEIDPITIIQGVAEGADLPKTSQPTPADFQHAYQEAAAQGHKELLCLTLSGKLSGTYQSATLAAEDAPLAVHVIDSCSASMGLGMMVLEAARLRDEGNSLSEVMPVVQRLRDEMAVYFTVGSLEFLHKGGRIGRASALLGNLLNIKPILELDDGAIAPKARARGMKRARKEMISLAKQYQQDHGGKGLELCFVHNDCPDEVTYLQNALDEAGIQYRDHGIHQLGAVITAHTGGSTFGFCMYTR